MLPNLEDSTPSGTDPSIAVDEKVQSAIVGDARGDDRGQVAAHQTYNNLPDHITTVMLLRANVARFYARTATPEKKQGWMGLISKFNGELDEFTVDLLLEANTHAAGAGHDLIRAVDASHAVQHLIPHEIDDFEDVKIFPRLAPADQITLEAHDCDSFRDFGIHWRPLERAIHTLPKEARLPDPFAAEILAEAISQYGILLLRVAGQTRETEHRRHSPATRELCTRRCGDCGAHKATPRCTGRPRIVESNRFGRGRCCGPNPRPVLQRCDDV